MAYLHGFTACGQAIRSLLRQGFAGQRTEFSFSSSAIRRPLRLVLLLQRLRADLEVSDQALLALAKSPLCRPARTAPRNRTVSGLNHTVAR